MRTVNFFLLLFLSFNINAQTYHSRYTFVKVTPFISGNNEDSAYVAKKHLINSTDTIKLEDNKGLAVIVGTVDAYSNDSFSYLELKVRKTNVSSFLPIGTTISCLIDYENQIIYDESSESKMPFSFPLKDSLIIANSIDSIYYYQDSVSNIKFRFENQRIEIETKKVIPKTIRGTLLSKNTLWGVSKLKTNNQLIELVDFEIKEFDFKFKMEELINVCTKTKDHKSLILL